MDTFTILEDARLTITADHILPAAATLAAHHNQEPPTTVPDAVDTITHILDQIGLIDPDDWATTSPDMIAKHFAPSGLAAAKTIRTLAALAPHLADDTCLMYAMDADGHLYGEYTVTNGQLYHRYAAITPYGPATPITPDGTWQPN